jgi:preprotein translocase subunit SecY
MTPAPQLQALLDDALRYWEPRRLLYNLLLTAVVSGWLIVTWPHFRPALNLQALLLLFVLAVLANVCYCAAYVVDIPLQYSSFRDQWRRWRWGLWLAGMLFAAILASYWIADEIYPYVPAR